MGPGNKNYGCLPAVNIAEMTAPKRLKNDPFVSTGALRTDVNAVNRHGQAPPFPLEPQSGDFLQENWLTYGNC